MYEELIVKAQIAGIHQEVEAQRWARRWRLLERAERANSTRQRTPSGGVPRREAGLREGR